MHTMPWSSVNNVESSGKRRRHWHTSLFSHGHPRRGPWRAHIGRALTAHQPPGGKVHGVIVVEREAPKQKVVGSGGGWVCVVWVMGNLNAWPGGCQGLMRAPVGQCARAFSFLQNACIASRSSRSKEAKSPIAWAGGPPLQTASPIARSCPPFASPPWGHARADASMPWTGVCHSISAKVLIFSAMRPCATRWASTAVRSRAVRLRPQCGPMHQLAGANRVPWRCWPT